MTADCTSAFITHPRLPPRYSPHQKQPLTTTTDNISTTEAMTEPENGKNFGEGHDSTKETPPDMDMGEEVVPDSKVEDDGKPTEEESTGKSTADEQDDEEKKGDDGDKMEESEDEEKHGEPEKKEEKPKKKKYTNWPLKEIKDPHENDVLYGRGGGTNHHPGNKRYRKMVEDRKLDYVNSKRLDKPLVALDIIRTWREQDPPGRFLKLDEKTGLWLDVGDKKAREKTSQALREKAPEIRKKQEEEEMIKQGKDPVKVREKEKAAKFAEGTKDKRKGKVNHAVLTRDHTLGTEYIGTREALTLDGFTWDPAMLDRVSSYGSVGGNPYPPGRGVSHGSQGVPPPYFPPSRAGSHSSGVPPPVPPPGADYYNSSAHDERQRSFARYDSWARMQSGGSVGSHMPPPPPPPMSPHSPYGGGSPYMPRGGSYGVPMSREHSLSNNPLRDASIGQPASPSAFARGGSGYWDPHMPPPAPNSLPPSPAFGSPRYDSYGRPLSGVYDPHAPPPPPVPAPTRSPPPPGGAYHLNPSIAQSWSSQSAEDYEKAANVLADEWSDGEGEPSTRQTVKPGITFPEHHSVPRPDMVKRMTSNQNEDGETRPDVQGDGRSIRRAPLNRNKSEASNRLKAQYAPGALSRPMPLDRDMRMLSNSMAESSLGAKPKALTSDERKSTMENITMDLMAKPTALASDSRTSTIEALAIDFDVSVEPPIPKPPALRTEGRLTTAEYNDLVNEPLGLDHEVGKPIDLNREASVSEWLSQG